LWQCIPSKLVAVKYVWHKNSTNPSYSKHTTDIKSMQPTAGEMKKAVSFVLNIDSTELRRNDLRILLKEMGFEFDEVAGSNKG